MKALTRYGCLGKLRYDTWAAAGRAMKRVIRRRRRGGGLHVYQCPQCHGFHLGRMRRK